MGGKTQVVEYVDDAFNIDIIEESQDVEEDDGSDELALNHGLGMVYKTKCSIGCAVVVTGSELRVGEDIKGVGIGEYAPSNDLLQKFSTTFEKADGAVGFRKAVVWFVGFGNDDDQGVLPGMVSEGDRHIGDQGEPIWSSLKHPFKECIIDTRGARGGLIRGWCNGSRNLFLGDRWEIPRWKGWRVIGLVGATWGRSVTKNCCWRAALICAGSWERVM